MPHVSRRGLLTWAALAALPAGCSRQSSELSAPAGSASASAVPSASPSASASAVSSLGPATTVTKSATPSAKETEAATKAVKAVSTLGGPVKAPASGVMLGSYLDLSGKSLSQSLALRKSQLGRNQRIVHQFWAWDDTLPRTRPDMPGDATLMISWDGVGLSEVTGGGSDTLIAKAARNLAAQPKPLLLRWGWEMNGNWFAWDGSHNGNDPKRFITAWKRLHRIFREEGADNVAWVWSPNWNSGPDVAWNQMKHYYPGDEYVDWVGVSGYNFDGESPTKLYRGIAEAYGDRKPIIFSEYASMDHGGSSKADWIGDLSAFVRKTPAIKAMVWFDTDTHSDTNFRVDSTSGALAAYRKMANLDHFQA